MRTLETSPSPGVALQSLPLSSRARACSQVRYEDRSRSSQGVSCGLWLLGVVSRDHRRPLLQLGSSGRALHQCCLSHAGSALETRRCARGEVCQFVEMDSAEATRVAGQAAERDRTRTAERRGPTCEISHDLRALAGRRSSVTNFSAAIKEDSFGLRPPLLNPRTLTCRKSARIA